MLIESAIGDAYGACFEWGCMPEEIAAYAELQYLSAQPGLVKPGCYTDDTQMMIALAESLVEGDFWTKVSIANRFVECFARDERRGYAPGFFNILLNTVSSGEGGRGLLARIDGHSDRSGAAMRAAPVGLFPDLQKVKEKSAVQCGITHNSLGGMTSGLCVALMAHYFYYRLGNRHDLNQWLMVQLSEEMPRLSLHSIIESPWPPGRMVSVSGWECVRAAKTAILENDTMSTILKQAVASGGDTDTVATIAMAVASCSDEIKQDLPQNLYDDLENGKYGRDYLIALDKRLFQAFPR
jgi:ADP-ribosylglycohydrolase